MKIAILTNNLGGGTGNHLFSMLKHWDKSRFETVVFSTALLKDRVVPDVPVEYIRPSEHFNFYPMAQLRYLGRFQRVMKEFRPDIVHSYFFWAIIYGRLMKLAGTVKNLVENREDQGFNWGRHEYLWLRSTSRLPDRVVCVSEAVKKVVVEREGIEPSRIEVVYNGIDARNGSWGDAEDTRKELGFRGDHLVLGMVANYNRPVKGVGNFLDAIPEIVKEVPAARFLFVGGGDEGNSLREKARSLDIEPYVVFVGYKKDISRYYEIMDISVLTSFSEGLSITLLESMAHGIPIVATRVGGNPEVVEDGVNGYLVPVKDTRALVDRIAKLSKDQDLRQRMGREGRLLAERKFQMQGVANRYLELYNQIIISPALR